MTREERLTAYALNDPSVPAAERQEIETGLHNDPGARQAVEETRQLAQLLSASLVAEQAAAPVPATVTLPAPKKTERAASVWKLQLVAASIGLIAVAGITYAVWSKRNQQKAAREFEPVAASTRPPEHVFNFYVGDEGRESTRDELRDGAPPPIQPTTTPSHSSSKVRPNAPTSDAKGGRLYAPAPKDPGLPALPAAPPPLSLPGASPPGPAGGPARGFPGGPGLLDRPPATNNPRLEPGFVPPGEGGGGDRFHGLIENSFVPVEGVNALSTFGVDVDTASYAIVRKYLSMGQLPPANAVRLEEMVNYFPYSDKAPDGKDPFAVTVEMAECPWQPDHRLVRLGLKAKPIDNEKRPPSNLVFLIDVSGSMDAPNRLPLVKASLKLLVNQLGEKDRVAMVVYAGASGLVLDSTSALKKDKIMDALDQLSAGGSTNGAGGIQQAYDVAKANFIKGGTNRVILCTDGDWNVGTTSTDALVKLIEQKRETGVFLSVFGFGMGNLRDEMMVNLAGKGNGNYGYIDALREAQKVFVEQISGTLVTVAKDVKIQIKFNPAAIKSYRLLGYEKRALAAKDFDDDKKDAGEMGAGHVVTALYELVPVGAPDPAAKAPVPQANEAFVLKMRHKKPDGDTSILREIPVSNIVKHYEKASEDFQFSAAVAAFAMVLRDSPNKGNASYALILELLESAKKADASAFGEYRTEFVELVKKAKTLAGK